MRCPLVLKPQQLGWGESAVPAALNLEEKPSVSSRGQEALSPPPLKGPGDRSNEMPEATRWKRIGEKRKTASGCKRYERRSENP